MPGPDHPRELLADLGLALAKARKAQGLTQEGLSERSGLHRTYVGAVERGERNPSFTSLLLLSRGLGIPLWELVQGVDEQNP